MKRKQISRISIVVFLICLLFVLSGAPLLSKSISGDLVFGTLVTWLGVIALPLSILTGFSKLYKPIIKRDKNYSLIFKFLLLLAVIWGFISYGLAGNWSFRFNETRVFFGEIENSTLFWNYTYAIIVLPILLLVIYRIQVKLTKGKSN